MTSPLGVPIAPFPGDTDFVPTPTGDAHFGYAPTAASRAAQEAADDALVTMVESFDALGLTINGITIQEQQGVKTVSYSKEYRDAQKAASKVLTLPEMLAEENAMLRQVMPPRIKAKDQHTGELTDMSFTCWRRAIQAAAVLHKTHKEVSSQNVVEFDPTLVPFQNHIVKLFETPEFHEALRIRGVDAPFMGLSERQLALLSAMTNVMDKRTPAAILKSLGIKEWEFNQWLANPRFKDLYRKYSEQIFDEQQGTVNVALAKLATNGDLASIKYFNELSGRWNPETKAVMNIREFMQKVVEIITTEVTDPDTLRKVGTRLTGLAASSGAYREEEIREITA